MKIRVKTWHARLFRTIQARVFNDGKYGKYDSGTSLCHYLRVLLIWGPLFCLAMLMIALMGVVCLSVILVVLPYESGGLLGVGIWWAGLVGSFFAIKHGAILVAKHAPKLVAKDSIAVCLYERSKSAKRKVCPLVSFADK